MPVAEGLRVGVFGLAGEVLFGFADSSVSGPDAAAVSPTRRAGGDLQLAQLDRRQRRLPERVVLLAPEQHPEQARKFARGGDDRDLVTAPRADPLVEGMQRTGRADRAPTSLDQRVASRCGAL